MARRLPNRPQRRLTPKQVRALRSFRVEAEGLLLERTEALARVRAINRRLAGLSYPALGRLYGISPRTVEAIATYRHYKEVH